jgi:hypothetical protein
MIDLDNNVSIYIEGGILFLVPHIELKLDLETAKYLVKKRLDFCDGKSYPSLFEYHKIKYTAKEAREYLAKEGGGGITAVAFYTPNLASRVIINSYLMIYPPDVPAKFFSNRERAIKWLKQFLK